MKVKIHTIKGNTADEMNIKDLEISGNKDVINQYLRVYFLNQSQGTSKTKSRSEVRGGGKKPWKQKGTGNARAGSIRSPIWVGGGVIHGPSPKTRLYKLNSKFRKKAFGAALSLKQKDGVIAGFEKWGDDYSTKNAKVLIKEAAQDNKTLVVHNNEDSVYRSFRNIPRVTVKPINDVNAHDILNNEFILVEKEALKLLDEKIK